LQITREKDDEGVIREVITDMPRWSEAVHHADRENLNLHSSGFTLKIA